MSAYRRKPSSKSNPIGEPNRESNVIDYHQVLVDWEVQNPTKTLPDDIPQQGTPTMLAVEVAQECAGSNGSHQSKKTGGKKAKAAGKKVKR